MKTTAKLGLLAAAFLLMLAGCTNSISPSGSETAIKKSEEGEYLQTNSASALKVEGITGGLASNETEYLVKVSFNLPVNVETVEQAVQIFKLEKITETGKSASKGGAVSKTLVTAKDAKNTKDVLFKLPAEKGTDGKRLSMGVYVYVTGKTVKAEGVDQLMDQDEDLVQGEVLDDDYGEVVKLGNAGDLSLGNTNYLYKSVGRNTAITFTVSLERGKTADNVDKADNSRGTLVTHVVIKNQATGDASKYLSEETYGITKDKFKEMVEKHFVVEELKNGKWEPVNNNSPLVFKYHTNSNPGTNNNNNLVAAITVAERTAVRVRLNDPAGVVFENSKYEYKLKYTTKANANNNAEVLVPKEDSGHINLGAQYTPADKPLTLSVASAKQEISVVFNPSTAFTGTYYYKNNSGTFVSVPTSLIKEGNLIAGGFKGFNPATIELKNFSLGGGSKSIKCTYYSSKEYQWKDPENDTVIKVYGSFSKISSAAGVFLTNVAASAKDLSPYTVYGDATNQLLLSYTHKEPQVLTAQDIYNDLQGINSEDAYWDSRLTDLKSSVEQAIKQQYPSASSDTVTQKTKKMMSNIVKNIQKAGADEFVHTGHVYSLTLSTTDPDCIYIAPAVEIAKFKVKYWNADKAEELPVEIGPMTFKNYISSATELEKLGWRKFTIN